MSTLVFKVVTRGTVVKFITSTTRYPVRTGGHPLRRMTLISVPGWYILRITVLPSIKEVIRLVQLMGRAVWVARLGPRWPVISLRER